MMLHTLKNSPALCALLSSAFSLSAGWQDWISSPHIEYPRITFALVAASTYYHASPHIMCLSNCIRGSARLSADTKATNHVTQVLKKRGAIGPDKFVYAKYTDIPEHNFAMTDDLLIHIPSELSATDELKILHAEARRRNHDAKKISILVLTLHAITLGLKALLISHPSIHTGLMVLSANLIGPLVSRYYCRYRARCADQFAILYAQNPEELESIASEHAKYHSEKFLWNRIHEMLIEAISTRPSDRKRAQYFQEAADEMRAAKQTVLRKKTHNN